MRIADGMHEDGMDTDGMHEDGMHEATCDFFSPIILFFSLIWARKRSLASANSRLRSVSTRWSASTAWPARSRSRL